MKTKLNKISKAIAFALTSSFLLTASGSAFAAKKGSPADIFTTTTYWSHCWKNVTVDKFSGSALSDMKSIGLTHNNNYHIPLINQQTKNSTERISTYVNSTKAITMAMTASYDALREMQTTIQKSLMREKLNYIGQMTQDGINENQYGLFVDQNGADGNINANAPSFSYYKNMCRRNKMFSEAFNPTSRAVKSRRLTSNVNEQREHTLTSSSQASMAAIKNDMQYESFCSSSDVDNNLCKNAKIVKCESDSGVCLDGKEVLSNALVKSEYMLSPKGEKDKNSIKSELFKTENTYSEDEEDAARAFAFNVVYSSAISQPTQIEKDAIEKAKFVTLYKQYIASLDLASYSFNNAIEDRTPISEGEVNMSNRDIMKYIHHNLKNPDNIATASSGKEKAMEVYIFTAQSLKNKIDFDRIEQNERIEVLLAAILTKISNGSDNIKYSEYFGR